MVFIKIKHVTKSFNKVDILKDVNVELDEGEVLGILGNGDERWVMGNECRTKNALKIFCCDERSPSCTANFPVPCAPPSSADQPGVSGEHCVSCVQLSSPTDISRPINGWSRRRCASCAGRRAGRAAQGHPRKKRGRRTWAAFFSVTFAWPRKRK